MTARATFLVGVIGILALPVYAQFAGQLLVSTSGNRINGTLYAPSVGGLSMTLDAPGPPEGHCCGAVWTESFDCNWVGTHTVYGCYKTVNGWQCDSKDIAVVVPPLPQNCTVNPPTQLKFDIFEQTFSDHRRVLLSNTHVDSNGTPVYGYPWFQSLLPQNQRDRAIPVNLRLIVNNVATPGVSVTLQVTDPPDPSPCMTTVAPGATTAPGSFAGDNVGTPLPTLVGTGLTPLGGDSYTVTSGANGYIETRMELGAAARAGDNYQITATATLPDGTTVNGASGVITAWKRIFVEKRQMFRSGAPLATDAPAGVRHIIVPDGAISSASDMFARNDNIMLLHAPLYGQPKSSGGFYQGSYRIAERPVPFAASAPTVGQGKVTTFGTTAVVGTGTRFTRLQVDDVINIRVVGQPDERRVVLAIQDNTHLTVHAPTTSAASNLTYLIGDPSLVAGTTYRRLTLDQPLAESYQREPLVDPTSGCLDLNDGVAKLAGASIAATDYFDSDDSRLVGTTPFQAINVFPSAFTEYVVLPPQPGPGATPAPRTNLPDGDPLALWFAHKWFGLPSPAAVPLVIPNICGIAGCKVYGFKYSVPDNHQLLLVGDSVTNLKRAGLTYLYPLPGRARLSFLPLGSVEQQVLDDHSSLHTLDPGQIMAKTAVHELAHQWQVNNPPPAGDGHCQAVGYSSASPYPQQQTPPAPTPAGTEFCTMAFDNSLTMPSPWNASIMISQTIRQYANGVTTFHMFRVGTNPWDSEYLTIRLKGDPWRP